MCRMYNLFLLCKHRHYFTRNHGHSTPHSSARIIMSHLCQLWHVYYWMLGYVSPSSHLSVHEWATHARQGHLLTACLVLYQRDISRTSTSTRYSGFCAMQRQQGKAPHPRTATPLYSLPIAAAEEQVSGEPCAVQPGLRPRSSSAGSVIT